MSNNDNRYCISEYIRERCEKWGEHPFLKVGETGEVFTYSQFDKQIQCSIRELEENNIRAGDRILLVMENSVHALSMFMACLISKIIPVIASSHSALKIESCNTLPLFNCKGITVNTLESIKHEQPESIAGINEIAYEVFTSGSTGRPKRVIISQRNMLSEIRSMSEAYGLQKNDRHLCVLPVYHASGLYRNILLSFHVGAYVVLEKKFNEKTFWRIIVDDKISFVQLVPSILRSLLMNQKYFQPGQQKGLKFIGSASAPHPVELVKEFENIFGVYVLQGYGMTEATCAITVNPLDKKDRKFGSIGKPLSVNKIEVLDDDGVVLEPGSTGRIFVSGDNIAICMEGNNEVKITGQYFENGRFDTQDIGYIDSDNYVWLVSRQEDLIKRSGYRMSATEIEADIYKLFPELEVSILGIPHPVLGQDIIAFVRSDNKDLSSKDIFQKLKKEIEPFKIPSKIIFVDLIPKVGVGKVDKQALLKHYKTHRQNTHL